jgi:hypothetical protein
MGNKDIENHYFKHSKKLPPFIIPCCILTVLKREIGQCPVKPYRKQFALNNTKRP